MLSHLGVASRPTGPAYNPPLSKKISQVTCIGDLNPTKKDDLQYIYIFTIQTSTFHVGKYTNPIDPMENITGMILVVICLPLAFGYYEGWGLPNGQVVSCRWPTSYLRWRCVPVVYDAT